MHEPILDAGVLRAAVFTMSGGLMGLLTVVGASASRVPPEVYNSDEDVRLLADDAGLSVLARDFRAMRRRVDAGHWASVHGERASLRDAQRLRYHLEDETLIVDPLQPEELPRRENLRDHYGIGRGEAASLVLAERYGVEIIYLSPGGLAYDAARREGVRSIAIRDAVAA